MEIIFRSYDGTEFYSQEKCEEYERRLNTITNELISPGLVEAKAGSWIAERIGTERRFLKHIFLLDQSMEIVQRNKGAKHLAEHMDSYIELGKWLGKMRQLTNLENK